MTSTDVISIGVTTRSRKRAREAAFQLFPALQDPHDRKKVKAESPHEQSQTPPIRRSPIHTISAQTSNSNNNISDSKTIHGLTLYKTSAPPPFPDDQQSTNANVIIPLRNPIEVIDLTVDRHSSTPGQSSYQSSVILSPSIRVTRSVARRAQLQAKLAQEQFDHPGNDASTASTSQLSTRQCNPPSTSSTLSATASQDVSPSQTTERESASGDSVPARGSDDECQSCEIQVDNTEAIADSGHQNDGISACQTTQQEAIPSIEESVRTISASSDVYDETPAPSGTGTVGYISLQPSGHEIFSSRSPPPSGAVDTPGSDNYAKKASLPKTSPSSYLAPNPVRRAPRISTVKRDTARYLLEATEKAALLAYRETKRQFPQWMSHPSRTFFKDSTYIPGGLPIRYPEDNDFRMHLNARTDHGTGTSNFISNDAFTLQPLTGALIGSFQSSHIQLDPDLDPSPLLTQRSSSIPLLNDSLGTTASLSLSTFPSNFSAPTAMHLRTKKGLWYNYALSVQHAYQTPSTASCGFTQNDNTFSVSFGGDFPTSSSLNSETMYDVEKDRLDWTSVPPYYPLSGGHMDSTSLPISSMSSGAPSSGAVDSYFETDLLPSLEQPCMTTGSLLTEWDMDCIAQSQRGDETSIPKTLVDSVSP